MQDVGYIKIISNNDIIIRYIDEECLTKFLETTLHRVALKESENKKIDILSYINDYYYIGDFTPSILSKLRRRKHITIKILIGSSRYVLDTVKNIDKLTSL